MSGPSHPSRDESSTRDDASKEGNVSSPSATLAGGKLALLVLVGVMFIVAAAIGRDALFRSSDPALDDRTALPRPKLNAPYIKTDQPVVDKMVELAKLTPDDLVYDLGCGDGRLVIAAALQSGCRGVGFDIDPERVAEARTQVQAAGVEDRVTIEEANVFDVDLSKAQVVLMYLLPWMLRDLKPQFAEMADGSRLLTHDFPIEGVKVDKTVDVFVAERNDRHVIYVYTTPLIVDPDYKY